MLLTLRMIREKYGSVEKYVTEHLGISRESVEQIRRNLIVDVEESSSDKKEREQRPLL
jgi:CRISPR/Cas system type I-B associated protein Csh2 (Cas7 group RAMP superfamily)